MLNEKHKIAIVTPFYPITHRKDLNSDTKAIFYLTESFPVGDSLLIIHSFMHRCKSAYKNLFKVLFGYRRLDDYIFKDLRGANVLFFENLFLIPKLDYICNYFNKKYAQIFLEFCTKKYSPEVGVIHFPTYYVNFLKNVNAFTKKIAILHALDIKKINNSHSLKYWEAYFNGFNAIGFRSYTIKTQFEELVTFQKPTFMCFSGIPEEYIQSQLISFPFTKEKPIKVLYAGRLDINKNIHKTLTALDRLKYTFNFTFDIIGAGKYQRTLQKQVDGYKLRQQVNFLGLMERDCVFKHMQKADVFIMLSTKETFGLVYLEAMAAGCIVIASKGQGIDGIIVDNFNGFLTEADSQENIDGTLRKVLCLNQAEQNRITYNARKTVSSLSNTEVSKEYYKNICAVINT